MGASARQLRLMPLKAWYVDPSTGRDVYGTAPGTQPAAARLHGPFPARITEERSVHRGLDGETYPSGGSLIIASTVAPSTMLQAVVVSPTTSPGRSLPVQSVRTHYDRTGIHHVTVTIGNGP